jgi:predicted dehydrogenase
MDQEKKLISRRRFTRNTSLLAGGALLLPSALMATPLTGTDKALKLAVVGCGGRGTGAASQALKADKDVKLVAMADAFEDRLENAFKALSHMFGEDRVNVTKARKFVGLGSFVNAIDEADVVILATPPGFRPQHFEYAIAQGKHVFMEKPVATDVAGIKKVMAAARAADEKGLNVVAGLQRRFDPSYLATFERIQNGDIGRIVAGQVYWNGQGGWVKKRQEQMTEMEYQLRNWVYFNWLSGDQIVEQHVHNIDIANWFVGSNPVRASGAGGREVRTGKEYGEVFDHHIVEFEYANGAIITSHCRAQRGCTKRINEFFQGTQGTSFTGGGGRPFSIMKSYSGSEIYTYSQEIEKNRKCGAGQLGCSDSALNPYQLEHDVLFAAIRSGEHVNNTESAANSTMAAIMGRMATYSGVDITWEDAMASNHQLVPDETLLNFDSAPPVVPDADGIYPIPVPGKTRFF